MYTALLCKIYRIMKLTEQPLRRGLKILPRHVIWPLVLVVSLMVFLLAAWSATGTSKYAIREIQNRNDILIESGYCALTAMVETPSKQIIITLFVLILLVQLVFFILAFKIRKINQELGDSKRILWLCFWQVITFFFAPLIPTFFAGDKLLLVYNIDKFLVSILPIGFLIFPRIYYVWYENRHGHLPEYVVLLGGGTTTVRGVNPGAGNVNPGAGNGTGITPPRIVRNNNNNNNDTNDDNKDDANDNGDNNGDDDTNISNISTAPMMTTSQ